MYLYWLVFFIIAYCSIKNWKRTTIVWLPLQLLFNECVCLKYSSPAVTLVLATDFLLLTIYFFNKKDKNINNETFIFKTAFKAYLFSYGTSILFSIVPISEVFTNTVKYFVQGFLILFLFHKALNDIHDIKLFIKSSFIVLLLFVSLGIYEVIMNDNPILDYVFTNAPLESIIGKMYYVPPFLNYTGELPTRYGMVRAYSFFNIHIAFGCASVLLFYLFSYIYNQKDTLLNKKIIAIGCILLLIGTFLCNSKTPLVGLPFFILATINIKRILSVKTLMAISILLIIILIYFPEYINNFIALFDSSIAEEGGGSNTDMRIRQFEVGLNLFNQNPLFGNGVGSIEMFMQKVSNADLLGSESSWLKILPERGLLGVMAYLILYQQMYKKLTRVMSKKEVLGFLIGLLLMETATGFMNFALYGSIVICLYRYKKIYLSAQKQVLQ